jgi:hypothetical protein
VSSAARVTPFEPRNGDVPSEFDPLEDDEDGRDEELHCERPSEEEIGNVEDEHGTGIPSSNANLI